MLDIENNKVIQIEYHLKHHVLKTFISLVKCSTSYTTGGFPKKTRTKQQRAAANEAAEQLNEMKRCVVLWRFITTKVL